VDEAGEHATLLPDFGCDSSHGWTGWIVSIPKDRQHRPEAAHATRTGRYAHGHLPAQRPEAGSNT
jgi:hypothetical protein